MEKIVILVIFVLFSIQSKGQHKKNPVKANPLVTIDNSEQFTLYSSNTQQDYKIYIHLPANYTVLDTSYPVIYQLDADIGFDSGAETCKLLSFRKEMPEVILVGIAYGAYPRQEGNNRGRDFSPTAVAESPASGGAGNFFKFIRDELIPVIDSNYRTNPIDKTLTGASFGGLFSSVCTF